MFLNTCLYIVTTMTIVKYTSHCYYTAFIAITLILSTSSAHVVPEPSIPLGSADVSADVITDSPTKDEEPELDGNLEEVLSSDSPKEDENDRGSPGIGGHAAKLFWGIHNKFRFPWCWV